MGAARVTFELFARGVEEFRRQMRGAGNDVEDLGKAGTAAERGTKRASDGMSRLGRVAQGTKSHLQAIGGAALRFGKWAGAAGGVAFVGFGAVGLKAAAMREQSEIAFTTMLGSGEKARSFLDELTRFANTTPFELPGVTLASQRLLAMGFSSKQVVPMLSAVGDAAAGLGVGQEGIDGMVTALGQMKAKGKATAEEMMQLTERGVPAWQMLASAMGTDIPTAMDQVSKGAVSADKAIAAVQGGMQKRFGGMMKKQANTLGGLWSTMQDAGTQAALKFITPFTPAIKKGMANLIAALSSPQFTAGVKAFGDGVIKGVRWIITGFNQAKPHIQAFIAWFRTTVFPIGVFLGGVFKRAAIVVQPVVMQLTTIVRGAMTAIRGVIELVSAVIQGRWGAAWAAVKRIASGALTAIGAALRGIAGVVRNALDDALNSARVIAGRIGGAIKSGITRALEGIGGALVDTIKGAINAMIEAINSAMRSIAGNWPNVWGMPGPPDFLTSGIPKLGTGGVVQPHARTVIVGERGPEMLTLPAQSRIEPIPIPQTSGGSQPLVVQFVGQLDQEVLWRGMQRIDMMKAARA